MPRIAAESSARAARVGGTDHGGDSANDRAETAWAEQPVDAAMHFERLPYDDSAGHETDIGVRFAPAFWLDELANHIDPARRRARHDRGRQRFRFGFFLLPLVERLQGRDQLGNLQLNFIRLRDD